MTTLSERISQSAFDGSRLRVVLLLDLHDGAQQNFLKAYEHMRNQVASVPGHISDQLCQSIENPSQWLITSEWESAPPFLAWVNSEEHVETVRPLHNCVRDTRSLRFSVLRETGKLHTSSAADATQGGLQPFPRVGDNVVRHALTFTVKPGSEAVVADILAGYQSPQSKVDEHTRLRRTSLFMHGNRVVRAVEVEGDLMAALRHVSRQPEVRAVEEAINPYLEQDRDLNDPDSARVFFTRAALPAVHHLASAGDDHEAVKRHALYYPAKPGCGMALARLLAGQDEAAAGDPATPIDSSTIFQRDDIVVRLVDVRGSGDAAPLQVIGAHGPRKAAMLSRLLDSEALGIDAPATEEDMSKLLSSADMRPITDRHAP
ncbi:SchA/CurD-like domain-containing protein [Streptomyces wuyuanensis]|uniref:Antibiotic biosynthesis monooxygenase n=1 Tax=Streptomyces wuyuanensis TaxID=1196353 RepID=A0A1G9Q3F8_9ACTN|nr:SchA/CurD-like domain-containing protein [Streptomyces wuyuanensis]SDM05564.1 Antibiotic biosynthesis monooxygenase [Streptomyces wuyuanensis]